MLCKEEAFEIQESVLYRGFIFFPLFSLLLERKSIWDMIKCPLCREGFFSSIVSFYDWKGPFFIKGIQNYQFTLP